MGRLHRLFIDFKTAYDSSIEFGIPMKLARLIKMYLSDKFSRFRVGKYLSGTLPTENSLKQEDTLSPFLFNVALEYAVRMVHINQNGLKLNGTYHLVVHADDVNILGGSEYTLKKHREALIVASKEI